MRRGGEVELKVVLHVDVAAAVRAVAAAGAEEVEAWWAQRREVIEAAGSDAERAAVRAAAYAELEARQAAGELLGSVSALLRFHLVAELEARGWWGRSYDPVPDGAARVPGRRPGSPNRRYRASFGLLVPDELGEQVRRGAFWASAPAYATLRTWRDRYGPTGARPGRAELAERDRIAARVITVGDVLRAAADRAAGRAEPGTGAASIS
jgi:hypothetical protein